MKRRRLMWPGAAVLLLYAAWWFSLAVFHSTRTAANTLFLMPALLGVCAIGLLWVGWRDSSIFFIIAACLLFAANAVLYWKGNRAATGAWISGWILLPAMVAAFEWIKNGLGKGWRFTNHQAVQMIIFSVTIFALIFWVICGGFQAGVPQSQAGWVSLNSLVKTTLVELNRLVPGMLFSVLFWR